MKMSDEVFFVLYFSQGIKCGGSEFSLSLSVE